ncbi:MAG: ECF transporter S component [Erysipelotrichia bacterium]|jgi:riboflavin transporter FmnP|nr:ECF transporter S component [Erysipelotrichia bacterium]
MKKSSTRLVTIIGMMSALSFGLYALEIPATFFLPFMPPYLKIDFSDIPAIITGIVGGPIPAIFVLFIKNLLHLLLITKESGGVGEIANFFAGLGYVLPLVVLFKTFQWKHNFVNMLIATFVATLSVTATMFLVNYFIVFPIYGIPREGSIEMLITIFTPFNLLRGALLSTAVILLFPRVKSLLQKSFA